MTDPEELRSRAASIFGRLRGAGPQGEHGVDDPQPPASAGSDPLPAVDKGAHAPEVGADASRELPDVATPVETTSRPTEASAPPATTRAGDLPAAATPPSETAHRPPGPAAPAAPSDEPPAPTTGADGGVPAPAAAPGTPDGPAAVTSGSTISGRLPGADRIAGALHDVPSADGSVTATADVADVADVVDVTHVTDDSRSPGAAPTPAADGPLAPADRSAAPVAGPVPPSHRALPRILAIANQKGGVGKTTTAVNLGAALAELGYRVLVVDLDPQGNATTGLGINARNLEASVYDVILHDVPIEDCIEPTSLRNLFVVPATIDLAGAEIELVPVFSRELRLRRAIEKIGDEFDFTLIDCPPSLGLLTVNGLAAATEVVVPIQCEYYALEGLGQLLRNVNLVQTNLNPLLEVTTIVMTMYDARTRLAEQVVAEVRAHFGDRVCRSVVPRTVRLSEAPSFGQPIIVFDSSSRGAIAYRELAKEVSGGAPQRVG